MKDHFYKLKKLYKKTEKIFLTRIWSNDIAKVAISFFGSRLIIYILGFMFAGMFYNNIILRDLHVDEMNFTQVWRQWDSPWYEKIAENGYEEYEYSETKQSVYGFMPLYPYSVGLVMKVLPIDDFTIVSAIFSNIVSFFALLILYKLVKKQTKAHNAFLFVYCFLPGSFYLSVPYTESLFILFTALVFYFTQRKWYILPFIFCGLAIVTRIQALALLIIPVFAILLDKDLKNYTKVIYLSLGMIIASIPLLIFTNYLNNITGDPIAFLNSQKAWNNKASIPFRAFSGFILEPIAIRSIVHCLTWVFYSIFYFRNFKKFTIPEHLFMIAVMGISTSTEIFYGTYRYVLPLIPLFRVIGEEKGFFRDLYFNISFMMLIAFIIAFVTSNTLAV